MIRSLAVTLGGRTWVQRRGELPERDGPIDVLTAQWAYVGTSSTGVTEMPDAFGPDGLAVFIELDGFDVVSVVARRLPTEVRLNYIAGAGSASDDQSNSSTGLRYPRTPCRGSWGGVGSYRRRNTTPGSAPVTAPAS